MGLVAVAVSGGAALLSLIVIRVVLKFLPPVALVAAVLHFAAVLVGLSVLFCFPVGTLK